MHTNIKKTLLAIFSILTFFHASTHAGEIHQAVRANDVEKVHQLLAQDSNLIGQQETEKIPDISNSGRKATPLHLATTAEMAQLLLDNGADIEGGDRTGKTPIFYALANDHQEVVRFFIENGANIHVRGGFFQQTPIFYAKSPVMTQLLLDKNAEINIEDNYPKSLLCSYVTANRDPAVIELLLQHGADPHYKQCYRNATPLHTVKNLKTVELLVKYGADIDAETTSKRTPLFQIFYNIKEKKERRNAVRFLLSKGANWQNTIANNYSLVHASAKYGDLELLKLFHKKGLSITSRATNGYTPLDFAKEKKHEDIIRYLEQQINHNENQNSVINASNSNNNRLLITLLIAALIGTTTIAYKKGFFSWVFYKLDKAYIQLTGNYRILSSGEWEERAKKILLLQQQHQKQLINEHEYKKQLVRLTYDLCPEDSQALITQATW